jgi:hypothetical protein
MWNKPAGQGDWESARARDFHCRIVRQYLLGRLEQLTPFPSTIFDMRLPSCYLSQTITVLLICGVGGMPIAHYYDGIGTLTV